MMMKSFIICCFLLSTANLFSQDKVSDLYLKFHPDGQTRYLEFGKKYEWAVIEVRHNNIVRSTVHHGPESKKGFYALVNLPFSSVSSFDYVEVYITRCRDGILFRDSVSVYNVNTVESEE